MIILFDENETLFQSLGIGLLKDVRTCKVKEVLNDSFELEMTYPITGSNFSKITLNKIILAKPNPYSEPQPFRIYSISKPINGVITVKAFHISYDMNGIVIAPVSGTTAKQTLDKIQNGSIISHNFVLYTDINSTKTFTTNNYYNMRSLLLGSEDSVLEKYKGEILFDKFNAYILNRRGSNKGAQVRYAKNMKDINHEINYERLYNGVYPFYHQETTETTATTSDDGFKKVYVVGTKPYQDGWLSYTADGEPYHPVDESPVQIASEGEYYNKVVAWNTSTQRYSEKIYNEMVNLIECVTGMIGVTDQPSWIYIDVKGLPNIVVKANEAGYFKLATETSWTKRAKGEVVFAGSIVNATDGLLMYYSEVIPTDTTATEASTTSVTHVELKDKIIWLDTDAAKEMKFNRILCLDLSSEFDETPDQDKLEEKAKEYIDKNKIGQYKYDTKVSFIDLASTTEGTKYDKMESIELGDTVKVVYEDIDVNVDLRVVSTKYDVLLDRYDEIELGEKPEKLSANSVQTGDNVSSLTNDVGYADTTTVNKLIAKTVTADLIQAKNAKLTKAQIEELQTARIKVTGLIEATQFELDTLVAKMLTADNAVIKQTLEAGTVKVKGDITVTKGSISIENTESGTVFNVDRDGNVTANSVYITGGELNINDGFIVTPDGVLTAYGADIQGRIEAESGLIAKFNIEADTLEGETANRLYSGTIGQSGSVLMSPGYKMTISNLDNDPSTRDNHYWAFLAGNSFGVDNQGNLYAKNARISGDIEATSGHIAGFIIAENKLYTTNVEISPSTIKYGPNDEFILTSSGTLTIQNGSDPSAENYQAITLNSAGLTASSINVEDATIIFGRIGGFNIGEQALYKEIGSFDAEGSKAGVYLGPDGLRIGKNLKIYPDGRIISGARNYNNEVLYEVGDYTIYEGALYKCISDTTGSFDSSKWEEVSPTSFGIDDSGKLTAANAEIIGNITAESGYIGTKEKGFKITENAIYNGFDNPTGSSISKGVYIGTDGIRLGQNVADGFALSSFKKYDAGGTYLGTDDKIPYVGYLIAEVFDSSNNKPYLQSEFILKYGSVNYDRWIKIREKENISDIDNDELDYVHDNNPGYTPIEAETLSGSTVFSISSNDYTKIDCSGGSVYNSLYQYNSSTGNYDFVGGEFEFSYSNLNSVGYAIIEFYASRSDLQSRSNMISSRMIEFGSSYNYIILTLKSNESPYFAIKMIGYQPSQIFDEQCWELQNISQFSTSTKYWTGDKCIHDNKVYTCKFTIEPGQWNSDDWIEETVEQWSSTKAYYTSDLVIYNNNIYLLKIRSEVSELAGCSIIQNRPKLVKLPKNTTSISFILQKFGNVKISFYTHNSSSAPSGSNPVIDLRLNLKTLPGFLVTPDGMMNAYNARIYGSFIGDIRITGGSISIASSNSVLKDYVTNTTIPSGYSSLTTEQLQNMCSVLGITYSTDAAARTAINNKIASSGLGTLTGGELDQIYSIANLTYKSSVFNVDTDGKITATAGEVAGFVIDSNSIHKNTPGTSGSVMMCTGTDGSYTIGGKTQSGWCFTAGSTFGVDNTGHLYATAGNIGSLEISSNGLVYTNSFQIDTSRESYVDPRTPQWITRASTMQVNLLSVGHNGYGSTDNWISFISSRTKFNDSDSNKGGMLINTAYSDDWDYTYYPTDILSGIVITRDGASNKVKQLITISVTRYSGWDGNNISYNLSGYGDSIISAIISPYNNDGQMANVPTLSWSGSTLYIHSDAAASRKYFCVWVLIAKRYTI